MTQMVLLGDVLPKAKGTRSLTVERAIKAYRRMNAATTTARYLRCNAMVNLLLSGMSLQERAQYYAGVSRERGAPSSCGMEKRTDTATQLTDMDKRDGSERRAV